MRRRSSSSCRSRLSRTKPIRGQPDFAEQAVADECEAANRADGFEPARHRTPARSWHHGAEYVKYGRTLAILSATCAQGRRQSHARRRDRGSTRSRTASATSTTPSPNESIGTPIGERCRSADHHHRYRFSRLGGIARPADPHANPADETESDAAEDRHDGQNNPHPDGHRRRLAKAAVRIDWLRGLLPLWRRGRLQLWGRGLPASGWPRIRRFVGVGHDRGGPEPVNLFEASSGGIY
jgi:hypothetical protein